MSRVTTTVNAVLGNLSKYSNKASCAGIIQQDKPTSLLYTVCVELWRSDEAETHAWITAIMRERNEMGLGPSVDGVTRSTGRVDSVSRWVSSAMVAVARRWNIWRAAQHTTERSVAGRRVIYEVQSCREVAGYITLQNVSYVCDCCFGLYNNC